MHFSFPYSTTKILLEISQKTGISQSILLEYGVQLMAREKLSVKIPTVNFDRIVNDLHIQEKIREQTDVLRVGTLFNNTMERINILKNNLVSYSVLVKFVKNEIEITNLYFVDNALKKPTIKLFRNFLKSLRNNKVDYHNHISLLYEKMGEIKRNVVYLRYDTKDDVVQKALEHSTQRVKTN